MKNRSSSWETTVASYRLEIHFEIEPENDQNAINAAQTIINALENNPDIVKPTGLNLLKYRRGKQIPWGTVKIWRNKT
jgi:hypothetical protein